MKIQLMKSKGGPKINVQYDSLQYKPRSKTFKAGDYQRALDFALALPDRMCARVKEGFGTGRKQIIIPS